MLWSLNERLLQGQEYCRDEHLKLLQRLQVSGANCCELDESIA
jgi:hypothetical protein